MDTGFGSEQPWSLAYSPTTKYDFNIYKNKAPRVKCDGAGRFNVVPCLNGRPKD